MLLNFNSVPELLLNILVKCIIIAAILPLHEVAHGWMAKKMGDRTAEMLGRLTLNPVKHIDPLGAIMIFLIGFGWAKPVPVYEGNFKWKNKKAAMAVVAAAGPVSNFLVAFIGAFILRIFFCFDINPETLTIITHYIFLPFVSINIGLAVFNLIPIPPLDGSKVFFAFLPDKWIYQLEKYSQFTFILLFVVMRFTSFGNWVSLAGYSVLNWMLGIIDVPFSWFGI